MPSPLWLYQPSSRKSKLLNKNLIYNVVPKLKANFNIKQTAIQIRRVLALHRNLVVEIMSPKKIKETIYLIAIEIENS